jgi:hypothetical protein
MRVLGLSALSFLVAGCVAGEGPPPGPPDAKDETPVEQAPAVPGAVENVCAPCISAGSIEWRSAAGPEAAARSALLGCRTYQHNVDPTDALRLPCEHPLPACDARAGITVAQVEHVLAHPDLASALARAPIAFGKVPRAADGRRFRLTIDGKVIEVGDECDEPQGSATCAPIPRGVREAVQLLGAVDAQEAGACK